MKAQNQTGFLSSFSLSTALPLLYINTVMNKKQNIRVKLTKFPTNLTDTGLTQTTRYHQPKFEKGKLKS